MPTQLGDSQHGRPAGGAGPALNTSVTLTDISVAPQITLPANFLNYVGATLRLTAFGTFSNTGTPTLLLGFYYGGVAGVAPGAAGATPAPTRPANCPLPLHPPAPAPATTSS